MKKIKVLIIDIDLQCNTTESLIGQGRIKKSLNDLLSPTEEINYQKAIHGTPYENLYLIPNVRETAARETKLIKLPFSISSSVLRKKSRKYFKKNYDVTLLDCHPNLGLFVINALMISDFVIVPNETGSKYSLEGVNEAVSFIEDIQENGNPDLRFLKILLTKVDSRTMVHKATLAQIKNFYPSEKVFKTHIPKATDIQKAEIAKTTIFRIRSNSKVAKAYMNVAKELLQILKSLQFEALMKSAGESCLKGKNSLNSINNFYENSKDNHLIESALEQNHCTAPGTALVHQYTMYFL